MAEQKSPLRIREGAFTFLLAADQAAVSVERRNGGKFEAEDDPRSVIVARDRSGSTRTPIVRLAGLLDISAGEWEYAVLLSDGTNRIGVAAEHIHLMPEPDVPAIQPFNPPGARVPVITGLCAHSEPEYLVLDQPRLYSALCRAAGGAAG